MPMMMPMMPIADELASRGVTAWGGTKFYPFF